MDPETEPLEIDVEAIAEDKLRSTLGKIYHELKKTRTQAAGFRTAKNGLEAQVAEITRKLDGAASEKTALEQQLTTLTQAKSAVEGERDGLATKVTEFETLKTDLEGKVETANRSAGQHLANFKKRVLDAALAAGATKAEVIDADAALALLKRDGIAVSDDTFDVSGVDEAFTALLTEKPHLKKAETPAGPRGTNGGGLGPFGSGQGAAAEFTGFRDPNKTLAELEAESNMVKFGRASISGA
jgi:flagellar biosynthesis chaperone FliJ